MLEGFAAMAVTYKKGKYEIALTGVDTDDVLELLSFDGQAVKFKFNKASEHGNTYREEPDNSRMFDSRGGVVENVRPVEPVEEPEQEEVIDEAAAAIEEECLCQTCTHLIRTPDEEIKDIMYTECDAGVKCPECEGICPPGYKCPSYEPIPEQVEEEPVIEDNQDGPVEAASCENCAHKLAKGCPNEKGICDNYESEDNV